MTINNHVVNKEKENIVYAINEDKETLMSSEIDNLKDFDADCILVLDDGRLVGKGTHRELLESCDVYRQIAQSQLSEEELSA